MKVEVSIGEVIDKLSILELKLKKINNETKKLEIQKEIDALQECYIYKENHLYYNLLMYVNEKIWDMTDVIKTITIDDPRFAYLSNQIFEFNQKRFRIKNWYNLTSSSNIKEQKSYSQSTCKIVIDNTTIFYNKIPEIIYLALEYDIVTIVSNFNDKICNIFNIPTLTYASVDDVDTSNSITPLHISNAQSASPRSLITAPEGGVLNVQRCNLADFNIPNASDAHVFELKPIIYISGGLLGDFIHQLSIINQAFLQTGRKGILYIAITGDIFKHGLQVAYQDTYKLITEQSYIKEYKIHSNNEPYHINLSQWRRHPLLFQTNWSKIFIDTYKIPWGVDKWLIVPYDNTFNDTILISTTACREACNIDFTYICKKYCKQIKFIDLSNVETEQFKTKFKANDIELYKPENLYKMCVAINSCKLFIGNLSSPLAFAYGMHKTCIVGLPNGNDTNHHLGLDSIMPNLTINTDINVVMEKIKLLCD